jgi:hypothetical protein
LHFTFEQLFERQALWFVHYFFLIAAAPSAAITKS